ncbi:CatB-related O-acetyltransferase [Candidatus Sulfurimonas marisnigri]|uniref:CatB-related O-acetyltransferase n=1 Tax=Candidatus Sulfurimonas marisnigri TaxID=2740405 RepID=A0A7S7LZ07_9BACT|nr:CatB-related O-acetyltransferase [Candidatus Sulfurimonas marisnigri]QOY54070.1 CatB-related O-acetyltransferase [Candidatus Sulfurimonas marisnigri]
MLKFLKERFNYYKLVKKFSTSKIYFDVTVDKKSFIGKNTVLFSGVNLLHSTVSDYTYIQSNSNILFSNIGKFCSIASNVSIGLANHPMSMISTSPIFYDYTQPLPCFFTKEILYDSKHNITNIESDVWIGQGAMIKSGVTIGVGAVIAAGAVVVKDVEPYSIVGGVPAKHLKYRFDEKLRNELYLSKWWELSDEKIIGLSEYFSNPNLMLNEIK